MRSYQTDEIDDAYVGDNHGRSQRANHHAAQQQSVGVYAQTLCCCLAALKCVVTPAVQHKVNHSCADNDCHDSDFTPGGASQAAERPENHSCHFHMNEFEALIRECERLKKEVA